MALPAPAPADAAALEAVKDTAVIVDLRNDDEKGPAGLPVCARAVAIPWKAWSPAAEGLDDRLKTPPPGAPLPADKSAPIITHCMGGGRGGKAKMAMEALGYTNVLNGGGPKGTPELFAIYGEPCEDPGEKAE